MGTDGCKCTCCLPLGLDSWLEAVACCRCPAPQGSIIPHIAGKDQNLKYCFYWMYYHFHTTMKSKNPKLNYCKSGTVCTYSVPNILLTALHEFSYLYNNAMRWIPLLASFLDEENWGTETPQGHTPGKQWSQDSNSGSPTLKLLPAVFNDPKDLIAALFSPPQFC